MSTNTSSADYGRFEELAEEFAARFRCGERPSLQEYIDRCPDLADEIRELFPALVEVERVKEAQPARPGAAETAAAPPSLRQVGDYRIVREIGRGGMGVVYEAEQISLGRRVALKLLPRQVSNDRMILERFRREARAAARLHHTNIVPVYDVGQDGDVRFYAMQFIQGQGLDTVIAELRRLRDQVKSRSSDGSAEIASRSNRSRGSHASKHFEATLVGEGVEVSPVLRSVLNGTFDPGGRCAELAGASQSILARALASGLAAATESGTRSRTESSPGESDQAGVRIEATNAIGPTATELYETGVPAPSFASLESSSPSSAVLPGGTQLSSVESGRRAFFRSLSHIGRQVAGGLAYAHARGIVHRDIKPSNLLLDTDGVVWITDFGLAKGDEEGLTQSGDILGTLRYMAPERFRGEADARADVYALGLTLYELITLRPGFDSPDRLKLIEQIKTEEPVRPRAIDSRIPRDLETIVLKAIEKDPKARYQSVEEMSEDLGRFLADEPIKARQVSATERYWRWARRNPGIAVLGGVLTALLIMVTVGSTVAASHFRRLAGREFQANQQSQLDRKDAIEARRQAIEERDHSRLVSAGLALDKGIALAEEGHADRGLLWILDALKTAPDDALAFRRLVRWNLGAWLGQVHKPLRIIETDGPCSCLAFSPDGRSFASSFAPLDLSTSTPINLWDTATGRKLAILPNCFAPFAFRPDGKMLIARPKDHKGIIAVDLVTRKAIWSSPTSQRAWGNIFVTPDGSKTFETVGPGRGQEGTLLQWDTATGWPSGKPIPIRLPETSDHVALAPDGRTLASVGLEDGETFIYLVDLSSERHVASWRASGMAVYGLTFSPDGRSLFESAHARDGDALNWSDLSGQVWNLNSGRPTGPPVGRTICPLYTPAGDRLVTRTDGNSVVRSAETWRVLGAGLPYSHELGGDAQSMHPDGRIILTTASDDTLRLWEIATDAESAANRGTTEQPSITSNIVKRQIPDNRVFRAGLRWDAGVAVVVDMGVGGRQLVRLRDPATGRHVGQPMRHNPGWTVRVVAFSPDGRALATGSNPIGRVAGEVRIWDAETGVLRFPPVPHTNYVSALAFQPDGKVLAAGDFNGLVRFWDTGTGTEIGRPLAQGEIVLSLAYSPDGKTLAAGLSNDHTRMPGTRLWDVKRGEPIGGLLPGSYQITRLEFRPDGRALLASNKLGAARLWDTTSGRAIGGLIIDERPAGFSPDGRAFLTLGKGGSVDLRDASTGTVLRRLLNLPSPATCAAFHGDGVVAVGCDDGTVRLCDPATSQPVGPPRTMRHSVDKVAFTSDGRAVAAIDEFGESRTWPVPEPLPDASLDDLTLRIESRTGLRMGTGLAIARLDSAAWRERLKTLGGLDPAAVRPDEDPAWHEPMVRAAEQNGNAFAAIWHLDRLIAARPGDWLLYARRARAESSSNEFGKAAADYQQAEGLGSRDQVLDFQAHCLIDCTKAERWTEALWYLDRLIAARPDDWSLREDRAAVCGKLGREADRQSELARVFELGADAGLVLPRAEELAGAGHWAEAAGLLARCGRKGPLSQAMAHAWAVACLRAGDRAGYREACAAFMACQGPNPTVVWNALSLASLLALGPDGLDDYHPAMAWFEKRLTVGAALRPMFRHYFSNALGGLLLRAGRVDEAITRLTEGMAAAKQTEHEDFLPDWSYLALAYARKGDFAQARHWLERLRTCDLQEVALLRGEAEALVLDAGFPRDPFEPLGP